MDVEAWLSGLGLGQYGPAFRANHIGPELLSDLTGDDLIELGVASLGHRKLILKAAAERAAPSPTTPAPAEGERRPVTVLFVDLSGYTALSGRVDPESLHALLQRFFALADRIVADYGGHIDKHVGDSVMAVFGAPVAHGDDPERAARAALAILHEVEGLSAPDGSPVAAHAGMAYGEVVAAPTGSEAHSAYTVTGDTVNLAARLTGLAKAGEIALSDSIRRLLPGDLAVRHAGSRSVKGLAAPVDLWLLAGKAAAPPAGAAGSRPGRGRFVGRMAEVAQIRALAGAVAAGGRSLHAHLRGEAGIGKSRIVEEAIAWARGEGYATTAVGFLDFGVEEGRDALQTIARAMHDPAAGAGPADTPFARDLTGAAATAEDRAALSVMDPAARVAGRAAALAAMLKARAAVLPQLIAIEDLHWANPAQRELLAAFLAASAASRCFFLTTSRQQDDPCLASGPGALSPATVLELGPLPDADARELAAGLFSGDEGVARELVGRSGGHPLFLEHLLRFSLAEGTQRVPDSVRGVVLAGVDRLDRPAKALLQAASVLGQWGSLDALEAIVGRQVALESSGQRYLVPGAAGEFRFSHALVRDAIHETLLESTRRGLHARAAAWFEGRDLSLFAQHLDHAGDPGAAAAYLAAATEAFDRVAYDRAGDLARAGQAAGAAAGVSAALGLLYGRTLLARGRMPEAIEALTRTIGEADDPIDRARAEIALAGALRVVERPDEARALLDAAEARIAGGAAWCELSELWHLRGNLHFPRAEIAACREAHRRALDFAEKAGSVPHTARALGGIGDAEYAARRLLSAHDVFARAMELAEANGLPDIVASTKNMAVVARVLAGPVTGLDGEIEAAIAAARRIGQARAEVIALHGAMCMRLIDGRVEGIPPYFERAQALAEGIGARRFMAENLAFLGEGRRIAGDLAGAQAALEEALAISRQTGMGYIGAMILGYLAAATPGDRDRRAALIGEGEALVRAHALPHNAMILYFAGIGCALEDGDGAEVRRLSAALREAFREEPPPLMEYTLEAAGLRLRALEGERGEALRREMLATAARGRDMGFAVAAGALMAAAAGLG